MTYPWGDTPTAVPGQLTPVPLLPVSAEMRLAALEARLAAAETRLAQAEARLAALDKP